MRPDLLPDAAVRTWGLVRFNTVLMLREPGPLISRLVMPLIMMTLLRPLYVSALPGTGGTAQAVTGMAVMFSLLALIQVGGGIVFERTWRTWDRLRTAPGTAAEILVGKAAPALAFLGVQQLLVLVAGTVGFGLRVDHPGLLVAATATWVVLLLCVGTALATLTRSHQTLSAAVDVGGFVVVGLGGVLVPLALLPGWVGTVAVVSPGYWGLTAMRAALAGDVPRLLAAVGVLAAIAAAAAIVACVRIGRGWSTRG